MFPFAYPGNAHSHHGCVGHMVSTTLRTWWAAWPNYLPLHLSLSLFVSLCAGNRLHKNWVVQGSFCRASEARLTKTSWHRIVCAPTGRMTRPEEAVPAYRWVETQVCPATFKWSLDLFRWDGMPKMYCNLFCFVCWLDVGTRSFSLCLVAAPHLQSIA